MTGVGPTALHYHGCEAEMVGAANYHAWILRELAPFIRGTVAEVGAGSGNVSTLLLQRGIDHLLAIEPSHNVFPRLAARLQPFLDRCGAGQTSTSAAVGGTEVLRDTPAQSARAVQPRVTLHNEFFHQLAPALAGTLDTVLYINVLEHIEDDAGELGLVREALRPGGHVCIFVPALQALYSPFDAEVGHVRRYHRAPLCRLLERAGLRVVKSRYFDIVGSALWFVAYRFLSGGIERGHVSLYDRWVVPVVSRVEAVVPPPFGKNLLVVAKR